MEQIGLYMLSKKNIAGNKRMEVCLKCCSIRSEFELIGGEMGNKEEETDAYYEALYREWEEEDNAAYRAWEKRMYKKYSVEKSHKKEAE